MQYPSIVEIKKEKEDLIKLGDEYLNELSKLRVKLEAERKKGNAELIAKLEEQEQKIVTDILRLDNKVKLLDAIEFILETKLFRKYFDKIEQVVPYDNLIYLLLENDLKLKKVLLEIYNKVGIDDEEVFNEINSLDFDDEENDGKNKKEEPKFFEYLIKRIKNIEKYLK